VPGGINDLRQPRISPPFTPIPEPGTCLPIAGALGLLLGVFRVRRA
jgi:hypothetical protein